MKEKKIEKKQISKRKQLLVFVKRNPLLTLILVSLALLFINIILSLFFPSSVEIEPEEVLVSEKASGTNLKPSDFPAEQEEFLRLLPEYNEYFGARNLPLTKEENLKVIVELYENTSRQKFDEWIAQFQDLDSVEFTYTDSPESKELGFSLARSKYANLIATLPYNSTLFTVTGRFDAEKGMKFNIYFNDENPEANVAVEEFINKYNLFRESLTVEYFGPFLIGLD